MSEEAEQHIYQIKIARARYNGGAITLAELYAVVDSYIEYVKNKIGKSKAKGFTRAKILRGL